MEKKWKICIIIAVILGFMFGIGFAIYMSYIGKTDNIDIVSEKELAEHNTYTENFIMVNKEKTNILETSTVENNISPNASIVKKIYYKDCDHLIKSEEKIAENLVNKTENEIAKEFSDWKIEKLDSKQIVLYKETNGNCGEHYFVQEHNGVIGIYIIDENNVKKLKEDTEISIQYLPEEDLHNLKAGIEITGYSKLTEFLEDYE